MVARVSVVGLVAAFTAIAAIVGLLFPIADLLWPVIAHPSPSYAERVLGGIRDLLFCSALLLAYFLWLHRRTAAVALCFISIAIAVQTLLLPLASRVRYLHSNPVFDPLASALQEAFPWFFLAAFMAHPNLKNSFDTPLRSRFSLRWLLIVAVAHVVLFVTATSLIPVSPNAIETFFLLPSNIIVGLVFRFGGGGWLLDNFFYSTVGPLLDLVGSALVWGCVFAFLGPQIRSSRPKPSNRALESTRGPA